MLAEYGMGVNIAMANFISSRWQVRDRDVECFPSACHGLAGKTDSDFMRFIGFMQELFGGHLAFFPPEVQAAE